MNELPKLSETPMGGTVAAIKDSRIMGAGIKEMSSRKSELPDSQVRTLIGIAMHQESREYLDNFLTAFWQQRRQPPTVVNELVIGAGYHAAVYCLNRWIHHGIKPTVIERSEHVGGALAMTSKPSFWTNQRNRPGPLSIPGDQGGLMELPGAQLQPSMVSASVFQPNTDIAFCIRVALAMCADVYTGCNIRRFVNTSMDGYPNAVLDASGGTIYSKYVHAATGVGEPLETGIGKVMNFPKFMQHMAAAPMPLRGLDRIAVVGDGDSGKCAIEAIFGLGPMNDWPTMLDRPGRVDWYGENIPVTCEQWYTAPEIRSRYRAIGSLLQRRDTSPVGRPLRVVCKLGVVTGGNINFAYVDQVPYDLVIDCRGWIPNAKAAVNGGYEYEGLRIASIANENAFSIGVAAQLPWNELEVDVGLSKIPDNKVAAWRLAPRTATFAAVLPPRT